LRFSFTLRTLSERRHVFLHDPAARAGALDLTEVDRLSSSNSSRHGRCENALAMAIPPARGWWLSDSRG